MTSTPDGTRGSVTGTGTGTAVARRVVSLLRFEPRPPAARAGDGEEAANPLGPTWMRVVGGVLLVLGAVELAVLECFLAPLRAGSVQVPLAAVLAVVGNVALTRLTYLATWNRAVAVLPMAVWLVLILVLASKRAEGDLVVPGTTAGLVLLFAGAISGAFAVGQVISPRFGVAARSDGGTGTPAKASRPAGAPARTGTAARSTAPAGTRPKTATTDTTQDTTKTATKSTAQGGTKARTGQKAKARAGATAPGGRAAAGGTQAATDPDPADPDTPTETVPEVAAEDGGSTDAPGDARDDG